MSGNIEAFGDFKWLFDIGLIFVFTIFYGIWKQGSSFGYSKSPAKKIPKRDLKQVPSGRIETWIDGRKILYRDQFNENLKKRVKTYLIDNKWDISCGISDDVLWYWAPSCLTEYYLVDE